MDKPETTTSIYDYLDFRKFLTDYTRALKNKRAFNLREFASKAGIKAPGYLKMVIDGRRKLTVKTAQKFAAALELETKEKRYFISLVQYNQSTDPDLKKELFAHLIKLRPRSAYYQKQKRNNLYFSSPHFVTIREMVTLKGFKEDPKWIASRCFPKISPSEAKEAIEDLLAMSLLQRDDEGKLIQSEEFIQTEDIQTQIAEAYHYHESVLDKARHALTVLPQDERNYYALSLPLPKHMYDEIIKDFYEFRDKIVDKIQKSQDDFDEVYQVNFQLFPLTMKKESNPPKQTLKRKKSSTPKEDEIKKGGK
jgi:uncharacterized protein (TIGR02147 family)